MHVIRCYIMHGCLYILLSMAYDPRYSSIEDINRSEILMNS